jgi:HAD superfamily hydrolase (TIGR01509 family)
MGVAIDPRRHDAVIFDLGGVLADTAPVHCAAWKHLFDTYLAQRPGRSGEDHSPFTDGDYRRYLDGKLRRDGIVSFLQSRGISVPPGRPSDSDHAGTAYGLAKGKNRYFRHLLSTRGVRAFGAAVELVRALQSAGVATAVFSSSRNCQPVLEAAGLGDLFTVRVDGAVAEELGLPGNPDPAMLTEAARQLGTPPGRCVVIEDAESGVEAGRRGGFALVIGVDRNRRAGSLRGSGAHAIVTSLSEIGISLQRPGLRVR